MKRLYKLICAAFFLFSMALVLSGCTQEESESSAGQNLTEEEALVARGRSKARICTGCHGPNGISRIPANPSLAGLSQDYISEQLQAFRSGERDSPVMSSIALNLTDADIAALSHYFASLPGPKEK